MGRRRARGFDGAPAAVRQEAPPFREAPFVHMDAPCVPLRAAVSFARRPSSVPPFARCAGSRCRGAKKGASSGRGVKSLRPAARVKGAPGALVAGGGHWCRALAAALGLWACSSRLALEESHDCVTPEGAHRACRARRQARRARFVWGLRLGSGGNRTGRPLLASMGIRMRKAPSPFSQQGPGQRTGVLAPA